MKGYQVKRKGGWDTHGLPVELGVEKELGITKEDIGKKITVEEYNQKCREAVLRYKDKWDELTTKMGYWVDLKNPYITFTNDYIESLWWILSKLYYDDKKLLYESVSIQPYSPAAGTGLSSHELNQPGCYKDVKDTTIVAQFALDVQDGLTAEFIEKHFGRSEKVSELLGLSEGFFFLAWTTTPWTLPANAALAVGRNIDYLAVKTFNQYTCDLIVVILAKNLLHKHFPEKNADLAFEDYKQGDKNTPYQVITSFKGSQLTGLRYRQLLPYVTNFQSNENAFKVIEGDFVTTEDGTGIVHISPTFGAEDYKAAQKYGVPSITVKDESDKDVPLVDKTGRFVMEVADFAGEYVKEDYLTKNEKESERIRLGLKEYLNVDERIAIKLKTENRAFKVEKYEHSYPHCWRTDKPVLYYPLDAWFIKTTALKDRMVDLNKTINWKPKSTGEGRFGNWLENMIDWNLSRSRYWGTPLPIWRTAGFRFAFITSDGQPPQPLLTICIGSKSELKEKEYRNIHGESHFLKGYLFDLEEIKQDILVGNILRAKVEDYVAESSNLDDSLSFLFLPDFNSLKNKVLKTNELSLEDLAKEKITLDLLNGFYKEIDDNLISRIDLHKPQVDSIGFADNSGEILYRVSDLIDVWFDSGAMPYAQWHFPFENIETFAQNYPANFIAEGVDQTRGWFYTLHALGSLIKESVHEELKKHGIPVTEEKYPGLAYRTCVSNGLVLDKNGVKMSKRLGNLVDPFKTIDDFGADATRWYLITNASPWDNLKFDMDGIKEVQRKFFGTLYNTYQFFALYANVDGFAFKEAYIPLAERPEIDRWILSSLNTLIKKVTLAMDDYEPTIAGRAMEAFVDEHLSNWYVRLCRRRFWKGEYEHDKICAYQTLYECLETLVKLIAPISPFFSDAVFCNLEAATGKSSAASVHHADFPVANEAVIDTLLEERMQLAQDVSSLVLSLRKKVNIKVRQPLQKIMIPVLDPQMKEQLEKVEDLVKAEVNIKNLEYITDTEGVIKKKIKPNFKTLGAKLGPKMKAAAGIIGNLSQHQVAALEKDGNIELNVDGSVIALQLSDVEILAEDIPGWSVAAKGSLTVALDIIITEPLKQEGDAREFVNRIQNIRKESGFELTDRIFVNVLDNTPAKSSIIQFKNYICAEILAESLNWVPEMQDGTEIEVNGILLNVSVNKKG